MPVVGQFHGHYWRARTTPLPAAGASGVWMYPRHQVDVTLYSIGPGMPIKSMGTSWIVTLYRRLVWMGWLVWRLWISRLELFDTEQLAIVERVCSALTHPRWAETRARVRACATTMGFNHPEAWVDYSRALKANAGQAQNVFRHIKVVHELQAIPGLSNPEAHLLAELAYQGFSAMRH